METWVMLSILFAPIALLISVGWIISAISNRSNKKFEQLKSTLSDREAEIIEREKSHTKLIKEVELIKEENTCLKRNYWGYSTSEEVRNELNSIVKLRSQIASERKSLDSEKQSLDEINTAIFRLKQKTQELQSATSKLESSQNAFESSVQALTLSSPWLAKQIADLYTLYDSRSLQSIESRRNAYPETVAGLRKSLSEKKHYIQLYKQAQYQLSVYENVFPFLQEFSELSSSEIAELVDNVPDDKPDYDRVRDWLSQEEYAQLDPNAREMMALERYINRKKTNWEVGIEYEQFVGYQCERRGYRVEYTGATQGLEDMGRDLVLTARDGRAVVIQCKRWSSEKTIHEKHIFQLYGTVVTMSVKRKIPVVGVFVTTTKLSDLARDCAHALGVLVVEDYPMADYPRIKCNIGKDGERIYHMPYDQQYNTVVISRDKGEFYTFTNEEAQARGYRRAWRWHGT